MKKTLAFVACAALVATIGGALLLSSNQATAAAIPSLGLSAIEVLEPVPIRDDGFEIQVLVNGRPLDEYNARGRTYIEATEGAEYEVRIRNPFSFRVAVALAVDGLNSIDARHTSAWEASKWVIGPYETIHITGWQVSSARARRFYFTTERDSYGAKLGQTENLGAISAVFFRERHPIVVPVTPPPHPRPREEDRMEEGGRGADSRANSSQPSSARKERKTEANAAPDDESAATGIGRSVHNDVHWVQMDLDPHPAAEVTIRYEYYQSLVRLGIVPRPAPRHEVLRRRESARGFEDRRFSPEP